MPRLSASHSLASTPVADASRLAAEHVEMRRKDAEPSLGQRLGEIGVLGGAIVLRGAR